MNATEWLQRWQQGEARAWVEARGGNWGQAEWQALVEDLARQGIDGLDLEAVGRILERCKVEYWNLRRWQDSDEAWRWVVTHGGEWSHHDWMTLQAGLQCWLGPLDAAALAELLATLRKQYQALQRWVATGEPARWVEEHGGEWDHADWLELLASLGPAGHGDLVPAHVGHILEECKKEYLNLQRWEASGEPYRWVEAHRGKWTHSDWERLLASLERSEFWPLTPDTIGKALERARQRYETLLHWQQSGAARLWVVVRKGEWDQAAFRELLLQIQRSEQSAVEPAALEDLLLRLREEYENLRRWLDRHGKWATAGIAGLEEALPELLATGSAGASPSREGPGGRARRAA